MTFANPGYLFLLLLLIPYIIWYLLRNDRSEPSLKVATTAMYDELPKSWKVYLRHVPFVLRTVALALIVIVLARPQSSHSWKSSEVEGIDIMMAVDVSTSMLAEDLKPNRLEAAKQVLLSSSTDAPTTTLA